MQHSLALIFGAFILTCDDSSSKKHEDTSFLLPSNEGVQIDQQSMEQKVSGLFDTAVHEVKSFFKFNHGRSMRSLTIW